MNADPMATITADECLEHLHEEARLLESCRDTLQAVRDALRSSDGAAIEAAAEGQQASELQLAAMATRRSQLTARLSQLGLPSDPSAVDALQQRLVDPEKRSQLHAVRMRVRQAARQVERLCRGNGALIAHRMELFGRMIAAYTEADSPTYGPHTADPSGPSTTIERDC